jgi:hypothetical protein
MIKKFIPILGALLLITGCSNKATETNGSENSTEKNIVETEKKVNYDEKMTKITFSKLKTGGTVSVRVIDIENIKDKSIIQKNLKKIAIAFAEGRLLNLNSQEESELTGLKILTQSIGQYKVAYEITDDGATIALESDFPNIVTALHKWIDNQVENHKGDKKIDKQSAPIVIEPEKKEVDKK